MITFIDDHRGSHGVEPICKVLPIAPSTYHDHVARRADPGKCSARAKKDMTLKPEINRVFEDNLAVYGVRKVWRQLQREKFDVARCTVERLMQSMGLQDDIRGKPVRTTISDKATPCPLDHVNRKFHAPFPTGCGCRTLPMSQLGQAWSMSPSSLMSMPDTLWAGVSAEQPTPALCLMPWNRPFITEGL